jgi:hypothetical protein
MNEKLNEQIKDVKEIVKEKGIEISFETEMKIAKKLRDNIEYDNLDEGEFEIKLEIEKHKESVSSVKMAMGKESLIDNELEILMVKQEIIRAGKIVIILNLLKESGIDININHTIDSDALINSVIAGEGEDASGKWVKMIKRDQPEETKK